MPSHKECKWGVRKTEVGRSISCPPLITETWFDPAVFFLLFFVGNNNREGFRRRSKEGCQRQGWWRQEEAEDQHKQEEKSPSTSVGEENC